MSLSSGRTRLQGALKELQVRWGQVQAKWDDVARQKFEQRHLQPLEPKIRNAIGAMEKMHAILAKARRDCG